MYFKVWGKSIDWMILFISLVNLTCLRKINWLYDQIYFYVKSVNIVLLHLLLKSLRKINWLYDLIYFDGKSVNIGWLRMGLRAIIAAAGVYNQLCQHNPYFWKSLILENFLTKIYDFHLHICWLDYETNEFAVVGPIIASAGNSL